MTGFPIIQKPIHWFEEKINGLAVIWWGLYILVGNIRQILQSSGFCLGVHIDIQSFILTFKVSFREHWFTSKLSTTFWNLEECKKKFELPLNYLNNSLFRIRNFLNFLISQHFSWLLMRDAVTGWKVSKNGVISGPYFSVFRPQLTPYLDFFQAVVAWEV